MVIKGEELKRRGREDREDRHPAMSEEKQGTVRRTENKRNKDEEVENM